MEWKIPLREGANPSRDREGAVASRSARPIQQARSPGAKERSALAIRPGDGQPSVTTDESAVVTIRWRDRGDGGLFPDNSETEWTVLHRDHTIAQLTCLESVDFTGTVQLTANGFVIDAVGRTADLEVTISGNGGEIRANPDP